MVRDASGSGFRREGLNGWRLLRRRLGIKAGQQCNRAGLEFAVLGGGETCGLAALQAERYERLGTAQAMGPRH